MSRHVYSSSQAPSPIDFGSQGAYNHAYQRLQPPQPVMALHGGFDSNHMFSNSAASSAVYPPQPAPLTSSSAADYGYTVARAPVPRSSHNLDERLPMFDPSAICLTESPVMSSSSNKTFPGLSVDSLTDGDPILFAGRQFHFVDYGTSLNRKPAAKATGDSPSKKDPSVISKPLDAFANDAPLIVSDVLLEPFSSDDDFESLFSVVNTDGDNARTA